MSTPTLTLIRWCYADFGTFGTMTVGGIDLQVIERPWLENRPFVSCIPEGAYDLSPRRYYAGGYEAIQVLHVPDRSHILFHKANWPGELAGCLAPNARVGPGSAACPMRGFSSAAAVVHLMEWFEDAEYDLAGNGNARLVIHSRFKGEGVAID